MMPTFDAADVIARLDRIRVLTHQLTRVRGDVSEQEQIAESIQREIVTARQALEPLVKSKSRS